MMPSVTARLKKNISRTKEKILQGMGKTDRTSDQNFDLYVENFEKQHSQANKLTKELNRYLNSLKETQKASKLFYDTLRETYETDWPEQNKFSERVDTIEDKWNDYVNKLTDDVQMPLISYLNEFPELKKKIEKRDNRLLDYDNARHTFEGVQFKNNKKNNSFTLASNGADPLGQTLGNTSTSSSSSTEQLTKLTKLKIDLEDKQHVYEDINQTLCMTLPVLYENRIKFYSSLFQSFFYTETIFHSDCVEIKSELDTLCEDLSTQTKKQILNSEPLYYEKICQDEPTNNSPDALEISEINTDNTEMNAQELISKNEISTLYDRFKSSHLPNNIEYIENIDNQENYASKTDMQKSPNEEILKKNHKDTDTESSPSPAEYDASKLESIEKFLDKSLKHLDLSPILNNKEPKLKEPVKEIQSENKDFFINNDKDLVIESEKRDKTLYKVKATYAYEAKEIDELTFTKDDLIKVVEGTESENEDLDEGWLIGIHEPTFRRGLFPANFTRKL